MEIFSIRQQQPLGDGPTLAKQIVGCVEHGNIFF